MVTPEDVAGAPPENVWFPGDARQAIVLIVAWKLAVLAVVYLGVYMLQPEAVYPRSYENAPGPSWGAFKNALHTWDTVHYVALAEEGYEEGSFRNAFYPVLPISIRALNVVTGDSIVSGLIVANVASGVGLYLLYLLVRRRFGTSVAMTSLALLVAFPTAFYLNIVYSEGPFLLLLVGFFLGLQLRNLVLAAVCAFLLPLTRPVGIFVVAPLAVWAMQEGYARVRLRAGDTPDPETTRADASFGKRLYDAVEVAPLQWLSAPALGLAALWAFMLVAAGDPFAAYRAEQQFIGEYEVSELLRPWGFIGEFFTSDLQVHAYLDSALDRIVFIGFVASLPLVWMRLGKPMFAMTLLLGIVPVFGSFFAYMRLVMSAFPLFVAYGMVLERRQGLAYAAMAVGFLLQGLFVLLHTSNRWVA